VAVDADALATLPDEQLQRLLGAVAHEFADRVVHGRDLKPFPPDAPLSATEALVVAGQLLRGAEISSFELASMLNI
jgi:hypothetical protein